MPDGYHTAVAFGSPTQHATFRQKRDAPDEYIAGDAERLEYDGKSDVIRFVNNASVRRLRGSETSDEISGNLVTYDSGTEVFNVTGGAPATASNPGGRVRAVLTPKEGQRRRRRGRARRQRRRERAAAAAHRAFARGQAMTAATGVDTATHRLEARGLRKSYGSRTVVDGVRLSVKSGEVVGLLGPNGAGKTTSFYMIVGLVRADGGEITIEGRRVERMPIHQRSRLGLSYLPQEPSIFRKLNVEENIRAVLELQVGADGRPLKKAVIDEMLERLLRDLSIEKLRASPAPALSGGERRRVEIARALATQPRFILLDEPFAGIDPIAVIEIQRIIGFLKERGIGVLITDHNVRETLGICDRAYIISEGRVLAEGTPAEIVANADVRKVYLGEHFRM